MVEEEGMKKDYMWEALSNSDFIKNAIMELLSKHMPPVTGGSLIRLTNTMTEFNFYIRIINVLIVYASSGVLSYANDHK